ncbi:MULTISPECIES: ROK family protein [unclassified Pseudomonas]|uniref:ROK family protein n=1 Tax=unclassified Pseudomonas TaxID=196821 RepID=UPI002447EF1B|nr:MULTISPECIES: ROK family protein [unclassified Pseudomonas]MDG9931004.1 ROK family protein [Pseudomonas sp. GD04042]MDH0485404.1 ROK family protein [Pseudomonas sp. GD04015]MDH0605095.1 ROK family protein [Pseudomonas sp. GD03869]
MSLRFGIDLGGTKTEIVALEGSEERLRQRLPTPQGDYQATLQTIVQLVRDAERQLGATGSLGVGIPGTRSPDHGRIKNANSTCLIGQDLQGDLERRLERPVRLANDADCFALSEATDGAGAGAASVFGVILGTGVGGGIVIHGRLLQGPNAIAGEWGHNALPWHSPADGPARRCYCGLDDCIETFLSGPAWAARSELGLDATQLADAARRAEPAAVAAVQLYCEQLARALASVINIIDPEVIVLGGGLSNMPALYSEVPRLLDRHVFSDQINTRLVQARHGDSSGVRGAAWLWPG